VFGIEIATCEQCGGKVRVLASIEDPTVIGRILGHQASRELRAGSRPPSRGPPLGELGAPEAFTRVETQWGDLIRR